ncbi:MAG: hypothetical protein CMJ78_08490 [Planctomycetaceae bacterium]|nr:hypothetical protein [Planctomycetaceae bacterium]
MSDTNSTRSQSQLRRGAFCLVPVLLICLALLSLLFSKSSPNGRLTLPPEYLQRDLAILQDEFPGYVLPLERVQLGKQLTAAIEANDEVETLRLLEAGADADWGGPIFSKRSDTRAPLFRAIKQGNPRIVEALLERGARVGGPTSDEMIYSRNQFSQTPLYFAVRCGNREIVDLLLAHGAMISATNGYSKTPIVGAVEEADLFMFRHLLSRGAVCDFESTFGKDRVADTDIIHRAPAEYFTPPFEDKCSLATTLIGLAHQSGSVELISAVQKEFENSPRYGPDLRAIVAVRMNDVDTLRELISSGYAPKKYKPKYSYMGTLCDLAANLNSTECLELLKQTGVEQEKTQEQSTLMSFVVSGRLDELKRRLQQGDKFAPVEPSNSPIGLAINSRREATFRYLLQRPEAKTEWLADPTLIMYALPHIRSPQISSMYCLELLDAGVALPSDLADPKRPYDHPLMRAASAGWPDVYRLIAEKRPAWINHSLALQFAAYTNQTEMCRYLLSLGADPDERKGTFVKPSSESALFYRNRELLRMLLDAGAEKTYPMQFDVSRGYNNDEDYGHPLYRAALRGDTEFCKLLLEEFPKEKMWQPILHKPYEYDNDIQYFDKGNTPLFAPVYGDHAETLRLLLAHGSQTDADGNPMVDVNAANVNRATALHEAIIWGASKCVQLLLASGADVTQALVLRDDNEGLNAAHLVWCSPFAAHMYLRPQRHADASIIFPMLITANIRHNAPNWLGESGRQMLTPLHAHARAGNRDICGKLLELGSDPNAESDYDRTPLLLAIIGRFSRHAMHESHRARRSQLCLDLVEAGAEFDRQDPIFKMSYYTVAYRNGLYDFCNELLKRGATPNIDSCGGEYLCSAVKHKRLDLLKQLIDAGADANDANYDKDYALHVAARAHDEEACRLLLAHGANPDLKDKYGRTALYSVFYRFLNHVSQFSTPDPHATDEKAYRLLQILLNAGADPQIKGGGNNDKTVLEAYSNMPPKLRQLIEAKLAASQASD